MRYYFFEAKSVFTAAALALVWIVLAVATNARAQHQPEPNPPEAYREQTEPPIIYRYSFDTTPTAEWTFHKSAGGSHPDGNEQQMMWLMNRARSNPAAEGMWLANTGDPDVEGSIAYFGVDLTVLMNEFAAIPAKPPAAFDSRLYEAAYQHSLDMISRDAQDHNGQFTRVGDAGFSYTLVKGNVFSYAENSVHAHAGFNIDWGNDGGDGTGMQPGRGHREAIMSIDANLTNVGIAMVPEDDDATNVGPLVVTGNYASANDSVSDHHNRFIVGTVWEDLNCNDQYDPGEGFSGVTVMPDNGLYYAVTSAGGGYAIPITSAGTYVLNFSGGALPISETKTVTVGTDSVLQDYRYVASVPVTAFQGSPRVVCEGSTVSYIDTSYPCSTSWSWSFPGGSSSTSGQKSVDVTYSSAGSYSATLTPSNEAGSGASLAKADAVRVFVPASSGCIAQTIDLGSDYGMGIKKFSLGGIDKSSLDSVDEGGYQDFSCSDTAHLITGFPYPFSIQVGTANDEHVGIYIDGNGDGDFSDTGETLYASTTATRPEHVGSIVFDASLMPTDSLLRLRVKSDWYFSFTPSACEGPQNGQVEDYSVLLTQPTLEEAIRVLQLLGGMAEATVPYYLPDVDGDSAIGLTEVIFILQSVSTLR